MEKTLTQERSNSLYKVKLLVMTGVFAAMACVATMVLVVPTPTGGYMNLGDTVVLLGAYLLGPVWGAVAGGVGSAMADLLAGYAMYVPGTLVIKALMAVAAGLLYKTLRNKGIPGILACGIAGEAIMVVGYWFYDALLSSFGGENFLVCLMGSAVGIPSNLVQAAFGLAASTLLALALRKSGFVRREFPHL